MTIDEAAFMRTILDHPEADLPRLVFADWLEEQGQAEWAEFIRLQVELAAIHAIGHGCSPVADHPPMPKRGPGAASMPACGKCNDAMALEDRERELWNRHKCEWFGERWAILLLPYDHFGIYHDLVETVIRRGFPDEVRAPLDWLRGGECERCERGEWVVLYRGQQRRMDCDYCDGTGRTPGHLRELVKKWPIQRVVATDREPYHADNKWSWVKWVPGQPERLRDDDPLESAALEERLWDRIEGHINKAGKVLKWFPTREAAATALSDALLQEARSVE